ncbi:MAG: hypothetical protein KDK78_10055 [Chlamydiia bacterium]|nr:hypothetical protein [Chlamydiia bacterium]
MDSTLLVERFNTILPVTVTPDVCKAEETIDFLQYIFAQCPATVERSFEAVPKQASEEIHPFAFCVVILAATVLCVL